VKNNLFKTTEELVKRDNDGIYFVDFLYFLKNKKTDTSQVDLREIKNTIEKNIKQQQLDIQSKWLWLATYYNSFIQSNQYENILLINY
jgi:hypothetical protein